MCATTLSATAACNTIFFSLLPLPYYCSRWLVWWITIVGKWLVVMDYCYDGCSSNYKVLYLQRPLISFSLCRVKESICRFFFITPNKSLKPKKPPGLDLSNLSINEVYPVTCYNSKTLYHTYSTAKKHNDDHSFYFIWIDKNKLVRNWFSGEESYIILSIFVNKYIFFILEV